MFSKFFKEIQENSYSMSISLDVRNYCFACWVLDAKALDCWFHHKLWICWQLVLENLDMSFWVQLHRSRSLNSLLSWFHPNGKSFAQPRKWEEGRNVLSNKFPWTAEKTNKQTKILILMEKIQRHKALDEIPKFFSNLLPYYYIVKFHPNHQPHKFLIYEEVWEPRDSWMSLWMGYKQIY